MAAVGLLMALSLGALLYVTRGETFYVTDQFKFAFYRHEWAPGTLLAPYNGHLIALPNAAFNILVDVGGLGNYLPYRLATMPLTLVSGGLLFVYARRRLGDWPAVAVAAVILFYGTAWQGILIPIGILSFVVPVAAGLAALLALDREDRRGDVLAGAFLILGLLSQSVALVFLGAATIELLLRGEGRRLWVVAVPAVLYAVWYATYGHGEGLPSIHGGGQPSLLDHVSQNFAAIPRFAFDGIATTFGTLTGPGQIARESGWSHGGQLAVGAATAACATALITIRLVGSRVARPRLWGLIVAFAAFWILTAAVRGSGPLTSNSRYLYPSAVLALLIFVEALRGVRLAWVAAPIVAGAVALSIIPNFVALRHYGKEARELAQLVSGELGALELEESWVRSHNRGGFRPSSQLPAAGSYFHWTTVYEGSPALDPQRIPQLGPGQRRTIDMVLERLFRLRLSPTRPARRGSFAPAARGRPIGDRRCAVIRAGSAAEGLEIAARSARVVLKSTGSAPVQVWIRRFGDPFTAEVLGELPAGSARLLRLPHDRLPVPWRLRLTGGPALACKG
jgi:hypothetical protein